MSSEKIKYKIGDLVEVTKEFYGVPKGSVGVICSVESTYKLYITEESRRRMGYILFNVLIDGQMVKLTSRDLKLLGRHDAS